MDRRNLLAGGLGAVAGLAVGGVYGVLTPPDPARLGGAFALEDTAGRQVTQDDMKGRVTLIYFGFTYCPEICPTTLAEIGVWLERLGPQAEALNVLFVSLDPERDTPSRLKLYLSNFDPRIRGLTGSPEAVAQMARRYRVYYRKVPQAGGGYSIDHSTAVYLFDRSGRFAAPLAYQTPPDQAVAQIRLQL